MTRSARRREVVLDASVVAKMVYPEDSSAAVVAEMQRLTEHKAVFHVPGLIALELGSIGWKKTRRGQGTPAQARVLLEVLRELRPRVWASRLLAEPALEIALSAGVSVYDAAYLTVAVLTEGTLITADRRLVRKLSGHRLAGVVRLIER